MLDQPSAFRTSRKRSFVSPAELVSNLCSVTRDALRKSANRFCPRVMSRRDENSSDVRLHPTVKQVLAAERATRQRVADDEAAARAKQVY